jgi:plastocyanin
MRIPFRVMLVLPLALGLYACTQWQAGGPSAPSTATGVADGSIAASEGATPLSAVIQFGRPDAGSPFPPPLEHDQSVHAKDDLTPRTVVIDAGGTVTFEVPANVHQLAIYHPGKEPGDVNTGLVTAAPAPCPPVPLINDPVMRKTMESRPCFQAWSHTEMFSTPGKYLVICTFVPHFEVGMYGWVIVRGRDS